MIPSLNLDNQNVTKIFERTLERMGQYYEGKLDLSYQDPGVALLEMFCLLKDMQQHYLNTVGDVHKLQYAKLMGAGDSEAVPAQTVLVFSPGEDCELEELPAGYPAFAEEIPFETLSPLRLTRNKILALALKESGTLLPVAFGHSELYPFGMRPSGSDMFYIGFARDFYRFPVYTLYFHGCRGFEGTLPSWFSPLGRLRAEFASDDGWKPAEIIDHTGCFAVDGTIEVSVSAPAEPEETENGSLYWLRFILEESFFMLPPSFRGIYLGAVKAAQKHTIAPGTVLGQSDGLPAQRLPAGDMGAVKTLCVEGDTLWHRTDDLFSSKPQDRHFCLKDGFLCFGNGEHGAVPPPGKVLIQDCEGTLGSEGQTRAGTVTRCPEATLRVTNICPAAGGRDTMTPEQLLNEGREQIRRIGKAVTPGDYRRAVLDMPGLPVEEAEAVYADGVTVVLYVKPRSVLPLPALNPRYRDNIRAYLDPFRLLTAKIDIQPARYLGVTVAAELVIHPSAHDPEGRLKEALYTLLPPAETAGVFAESLSHGELYGTAASLSFVKRVRRFWFICGGKTIKAGLYPCGPGVIPYLAGMEITWVRE